MFKLIKRIFKCVDKKQKNRLFLLQILNLLTALLNVFAVLMIAPFVAILTNPETILKNKYYIFFQESFSLTQSDDLSLIFSVILISLLVISTLFNLIITYLNLKWSADLQVYFSKTLYNYFINRNWIFHANTSAYNLTSKVHSDTQRLTSTVIAPFMDLLTNSILAIFLFLAVLLVNFKIALFLIIIFGLSYLFFYLVFNKNLSTIGKELTKTIKIYYKYLFEGFASIRDSILLNKISFFRNKFSKNVLSMNSLMVKEQFITKLPRNIIEIVFFIIMISVTYYMGRVLNLDVLNFGPIIAFYAICAIKIIPTLQKIFNSFSMIRVHHYAFDTIEKDLLDAKREFDENYNIKVKKNLNFKNSIELRDISFIYPGTRKAGVFNINIKIPYKSIVGFYGKTGSGKSTIMDLILGLLKPDSGQIFVDGVNILNNIQNWQKNLSYVPQQFFIYDENLKNNIAFAQDEKDIDYKKIEYCLKSACLDEFINDLNYNVGERGERVSGGQKQRIAIARSLYKNSEILFLDEATSALDNLTEKKILQNLLKNENIKTIILISHRFDTLRMCDILYEVKEGKAQKIENIKELEEKYQIKK